MNMSAENNQDEGKLIKCTRGSEMVVLVLACGGDGSGGGSCGGGCLQVVIIQNVMCAFYIS